MVRLLKSLLVLQVLAGAGVASRRTAEELIFEGRVSVNNKTERLPQTHVSPVKDKVRRPASEMTTVHCSLTFVTVLDYMYDIACTDIDSLAADHY